MHRRLRLPSLSPHRAADACGVPQMKYAVLTLCLERGRYVAGVLAVAFSRVLVALQIGIMLGLVSLVSLPVDLSTADVWIASHNTPSCDLGLPISRKWTDRLAMQPEVA